MNTIIKKFLLIGDKFMYFFIGLLNTVKECKSLEKKVIKRFI